MEIIWLLFGAAAVSLAVKQKETIFTMILGFLLGPIGLLIIFLKKGNSKKCFFCKEIIFKEATVCPKCNRDLPVNIKEKSQPLLKNAIKVFKESRMEKDPRI